MTEKTYQKRVVKIHGEKLDEIGLLSDKVKAVGDLLFVLDANKDIGTDTFFVDIGAILQRTAEQIMKIATDGPIPLQQEGDTEGVV